MFISEKKLEKTIVSAIQEVLGKDEGEILDVKKELARVKIELRGKKEALDDVKYEHKKEKRDIEHLVKIKEEKNEIELEKEKAKVQTEYSKKEMTLLKENQEQVLTQIKEGEKKLQELYSKIIDRLPKFSHKINEERES